MLNPNIVLNSKDYYVAVTRYEPTREKLQNVVVTVGKTTKSQSFGFTDYRWGFDLIVPDVGAGSDGDIDDLRAAYALEYCGFTDHYGTEYSNGVFFTTPLTEPPFDPMLHKFIVGVQFRLRQV